jgi:hypothetical protein
LRRRAYTLPLATSLWCRHRRPLHGRSWNGTHEIEESESSERLGDESEKFIDYAICVAKNGNTLFHVVHHKRMG